MLKKLKKYHWVSLFVAFIVVNNIVALTFCLGNPYYLIMAGSLGILIMNGGVKNLKMPYVAFIVICALSIATNKIPASLHPWLRFMTLAFVLSLVTPMLQSPALRRFRWQTFVLIQYLCVAVTIISFFATLGGYNSMKLSAGRTGITTQVMVMGPLAAMSMVFCVYQVWVQKSKKIRLIEKLIFGFGAFCGFAMCMMAVSRIGIVSGAMGIVALIVYKSRFKMGKSMIYVATVTLTLIATYPLWNAYIAQAKEKNERAVVEGGMLNSRQGAWQARIDEFKSSPLFGVGLASYDLGDENPSLDDDLLADNENIRVEALEPGSGWLVVLSMTGIFNFVLFVWFYWKAFQKTYRSVTRRWIEPYCLLGALLVLFATHMLAEGYSLAAGGFLFFCMWLMLGVIDAWPKDKYKVEL